MILRARGALFTPPLFSRKNPTCRLTLPPHLLEPSTTDLLHRISALDHCYAAFFVQPPSWSLLHEALIENNQQTSIRGSCSRPSSWTFVKNLLQPGLRPEPSSRTFSSQAFVLDLRQELSPARPSFWTFVENLLQPGLRPGPSSRTFSS